MRVKLPAVDDESFRRIHAAIEAAFEQIKQYAVLPPGGAAGSVLAKLDARDYHATWEVRADTAAHIASKTAAINTTGKYQGRVVYDTTNNRLMVADGSADVSLWYRADGGLSVTPV